jgi:hypothetical protein
MGCVGTPRQARCCCKHDGGTDFKMKEMCHPYRRGRLKRRPEDVAAGLVCNCKMLQHLLESYRGMKMWLQRVVFVVEFCC